MQDEDENLGGYSFFFQKGAAQEVEEEVKEVETTDPQTDREKAVVKEETPLDAKSAAIAEFAKANSMD